MKQNQYLAVIFVLMISSIDLLSILAAFSTLIFKHGVYTLFFILKFQIKYSKWRPRVTSF